MFQGGNGHDTCKIRITDTMILQRNLSQRKLKSDLIGEFEG